MNIYYFISFLFPEMPKSNTINYWHTYIVVNNNISYKNKFFFSFMANIRTVI